MSEVVPFNNFIGTIAVIKFIDTNLIVKVNKMAGSCHRREVEILKFLETSNSEHESNGSNSETTDNDDESVQDAILSSIQPIPSTTATLPTALPRGNSAATD
jgi:hypothetical protein